MDFTVLIEWLIACLLFVTAETVRPVIPVIPVTKSLPPLMKTMEIPPERSKISIYGVGYLFLRQKTLFIAAQASYTGLLFLNANTARKAIIQSGDNPAMDVSMKIGILISGR